jgi:hypothetical protein
LTRLSEYLSGDYHEDRRELQTIRDFIEHTIRTLDSAFDVTYGWPYAISTDGPEPITNISHSTTAMVASALAQLVGDNSKGELTGDISNSRPFTKSNEIEKGVLESISRKYLLAIDLVCRSISSNKRTISSTFGEDDPITASYLASLLFRNKSNETNPHVNSVREILTRITERLSKERDINELCSRLGGSDFFGIANAAIPLRCVRLIRDVYATNKIDLNLYRDYFENTIHANLSFYSIPDSRFDPAELSFCLEGLLRSGVDLEDSAIFKRIIEVVHQYQDTNASWRPTKPFLANNKGLSLFPISVDVANSLLISCALFQDKNYTEALSSSIIASFKRYFAWLRARTVRIVSSSKHFWLGWHSEHVNEKNIIHVWETSQVLEFLINYHKALERHVANRTLTLSQLNVKR